MSLIPCWLLLAVAVAGHGRLMAVAVCAASACWAIAQHRPVGEITPAVMMAAAVAVIINTRRRSIWYGRCSISPRRSVRNRRRSYSSVRLLLLVKVELPRLALIMVGILLVVVLGWIDRYRSRWRWWRRIIVVMVMVVMVNCLLLLRLVTVVCRRWWWWWGRGIGWVGGGVGLLCRGIAPLRRVGPRVVRSVAVSLRGIVGRRTVVAATTTVRVVVVV